MTSSNFCDLREDMVKRHIKARGINDVLVLEAMTSVPREHFVPRQLQARTYDDGPLPIGQGQTISQPFVVALMAQALEIDQHSNILEIGTGSGYGAAILSRIGLRVTTIERLGTHVTLAKARFKECGYENIDVIHGDGSQGFEAEAPYDAIVATACGEEVPPALKQQLAIGGHLVMPVKGGHFSQRLIKLTRISSNEFNEKDLGPVAFVPLISEIEK